MKILHIIILDKLKEKYGKKEMSLKEIKEHMKLIHRIPKEMINIVIADMINENELVKTDAATYRLRKDIEKRIESSMKEHKLTRNNIFA